MVAPVSDLITGSSLPVQIVGEGGWCDHGPCANGRLQKGTAEGEYGGSFRTSSLGKKDDGTPLTERFLHATELIGHLRGIVPADEDGPGIAGKPTEGRPGIHVTLRDKDRRTDRSKDKDVDISEMIGGDEAAHGNSSGNLDPAMQEREKTAAHPLHPGDPRGDRVGSPDQEPAKGGHAADDHPTEPQKPKQNPDRPHHRGDRIPVMPLGRSKKRPVAVWSALKQSIMVRKSMVPNSLSIAGVEQILAPTPR